MRATLRTLALRAGLPLVTVLSLASPASAASLRAVQPAPHAVAGANDVGAASADQRLDLQVVLRPRDPQGLADLAAAVSMPGSPFFHRYLPAGAFARRFGPAPATLAALRKVLRDAGLQPADAPVDGVLLPVTGTVAQVEAALHTPLRAYHLPDGSHAVANTAAPTLPATVAGDVASIVGLDTRARLRPADLAAHATTAAGGPAACPDAAAVDGVGGWTADQLAQAYGFDSLYSAGYRGAGATVAIYSLEPYSVSDIAAYQSCYGTSTSVSNALVDGGAGSGAGQGEAALDIETVIGLAPGARLQVYEGPNGGSGPLDVWRRIATDDTASVVTTSWGLCEPQVGAAEAAAEAIVFQQMAAQGQTVLAASGDAGSEDCGGNDTSLAVDDPASQAYVTGVGGTSLASIASPPSETVWNDQYGAGGGGISALTARPSWQGGGSGGRQVPDVSASADPAHPYAVSWKGAWYGFGGTSAAAPLWAALTAVLNSTPGCATAPVGFLNPRIYQLTDDFNDVTSGNNDLLGAHGGAFAAAVGYDMASGLGTPIAGKLAADLCSTSTSGSSSVGGGTGTSGGTTGGGSTGTGGTTSSGGTTTSGSTSTTTTTTTTAPAPSTTATAPPPSPTATATSGPPRTAVPARVTLGRLPHGGLRVTYRGLLAIPLVCSSGSGGCRISLRLTTPTGRLLALLRLGRLAPGAHGRLVLHLSRTRLAALERHHARRVRLRLRIATSGGGDRTVTLLVRLPARR
jgi:subtilase family serine protease